MSLFSLLLSIPLAIMALGYVVIVFTGNSKEPQEVQLVLVGKDGHVGRYLHLVEDEWMDSDEVARVAVLIANRQYKEFHSK